MPTDPETMPVLFLSHGSPTLPFDEIPARDFLSRLGQRLPEPKAILCISAHWEAMVPSLTAAARPATIHDFYGFPKSLYELRYDAPGDPALAAELATALRAKGYDPLLAEDRGLDHGAWNPLLLIYPQAHIPVIQLSILHHHTPAQHVALGRAIAPFAQAGTLILASGGAVHNLRAIDWRGRGAPPDWAKTFDDWLAEKIAAGDLDSLTRYRQILPEGEIAHPSEDHILPLFVALGAAEALGTLRKAQRLHASFALGSLSMAAFGWGI